MKLELKHIAPYLPYGLPLAIDVSLGFREEWAITGEVMNTSDSYACCNGIHTVIEGKNIKGTKVKPTLRPLSDLTKDINSFIGLTYIEWLEETYPTLDLHKQATQVIKDNRWIDHCDYLLILFLLEHHFDVFNLIDNNLAININDL